MKNLKKILTIVSLLAISQLLIVNNVLNAQNIGINQPTPDNSALLDMTSTERGLLIPRVTLNDVNTATPIISPVAEGLLIYNETGTQPHGFYYWDGLVWKMVGSNGYITAFSWTDATDLLRITEAGTNWDVTIDNEADDVTLADVQAACTNNFHNIGGTDAVNDADNVIGNEYNTSMGWNDGTNTVSVTDGGGTKSVVLTGFLESEVDASITNELITAFSWTDATDLLRITEAGTNWDVTIDNEADDVTLTDVQNACTNDFHNIGGTDAVNDADNVIGNEYNTSMGWDDGTNTVSVTDGGGTKSVVITGFDNYSNWKLQANGGATTNITSGATVNFAQGGATTVSRAGNTVTISSTDNTGSITCDWANNTWRDSYYESQTWGCAKWGQGISFYCSGGIITQSKAVNVCIAESGGCSCFKAGTKITMADGSEKNIEEVKIGEKVLGYDGSINTVIKYDRPTIGDRSIYIINRKVKVTGEHPFLAKDGWKVADLELFWQQRKDHKRYKEVEPLKLKINDVLITKDG